MSLAPCTMQQLQKNPTLNSLSMTEGWAKRLPTAEITHVADKRKNVAEPAGGGHDGRLRATDTASAVGACSECGHARIPWKYLTHMEPAEGTIQNTKYACNTGQTRNKLLEQWVHLTNHTAGHSRRRRRTCSNTSAGTPEAV